jgi:hypothetical protein
MRIRHVSALLTTSMSCGCWTSCFTAGVRVATAVGPRRIAELVAGDEVLGFDVAARAVVKCRVARVHRGSAARLARVVVGDVAIDGVTGEHPFYDPERGRWVPASALAPGSAVVVRTATGTVPGVISAVDWRDATAEVYNLSVDGPETYFAEGVLVHNKSEACYTANSDVSVVALDTTDPHSQRVPRDVFAELAFLHAGPAVRSDGSTVDLTVSLSTEATTGFQEYTVDDCGYSTDWVRFPVTVRFVAADGSFDEDLPGECALAMDLERCYLDASVDWTMLTGTFDVASAVSPAPVDEVDELHLSGVFDTDEGPLRGGAAGVLDVVFSTGRDPVTVLTWDL